MRKTTFPILLAATFAFSAPVYAESDLGKVISGIAQSLIDQETDRTVYIDAQRRNTASAYRNYLDKYPNGAFRGNAQKALAKLGATVGVIAQLTLEA